MLSRRGLITSLISLVAAPAIVRAASLDYVPRERTLIVPGADVWTVVTPETSGDLVITITSLPVGCEGIEYGCDNPSPWVRYLRSGEKLQYRAGEETAWQLGTP